MEALIGFVSRFFLPRWIARWRRDDRRNKDIRKEEKKSSRVHDLLATNFCTTIAPPCTEVALFAPKLPCHIPELLLRA
jgi:hypothetical protein